MTTQLNIKQFLGMIIAGKDYLEEHVDEVNALNELPIPDHDTGTNMLHTMKFALDDLQHLENDLGDLALRISIGMSISAKGKSGEVLARFFDGFVEPLEHESHLNAQLLRYSFQNAQSRLLFYHQINANCIPSIIQIIERMVDVTERLSKRTLLCAIVHRMVADAQDYVRDNNITDAGCIGLLYVIEGMQKYLHERSVGNLR